MILTTCAACAASLAHDAPRCVRCWTRYCDATCQHDHWRRGHKQICKKIHRGGNAEQYYADKKYKEAVAVAVEACAEDTKGQKCYICLEAVHSRTGEGLVRGCACGDRDGVSSPELGVAHVSCLARQAKILRQEAEENNLGVDARNASASAWPKSPAHVHVLREKQARASSFTLQGACLRKLCTVVAKSKFATKSKHASCTARTSMRGRRRRAAAALLLARTAGGFLAPRPKCSTARRAATQEPVAEITAEPCNVVLTTTNCDFDSLAAACALASLWGRDPEFSLVPTHVVMPRGAVPVVQRFLAYHKHVLPVRGFKTIDGSDIEALGVVDASSAARLGRSKRWLSLAQSLHVYDHHVGGEGEESESLGLHATEVVVEPVGSTTTLIVERLRDADVTPSVPEATLYVLGIRADTGGLAYETTTARDADALAWLLRKGASQAAIAEFGVERISGDQRKILATALRTVESRLYRGVGVATVAVRSKGYVPGLAAVVEELLELTAADVLIMACEHQNGLDLIGRARPGAATVDLRTVMSKFGGGGHARAAAAAVPENDRKAMGAPRNVLDVAREYVLGQIPAEPTAAAIMTSSVVTLKDDATIADARRLLNAHSLKATAVVDAKGRLRGVLKMSDVSKAEKAGRQNDKVKGVMRTQVTTVSRDTPLARLEEILVTTVGRVPVVEDDGRLLGIVTRTDLLRLRNYYGGELPRPSALGVSGEAGPG